MSASAQEGVTPESVMKCCLLAGELLLKYGAETERVEDTIIRIAKTSGVENVHIFVVPTGLFISMDCKNYQSTQLVRIRLRAIELNKVAKVNDISRRLADGRCTLTESFREMEKRKGYISQLFAAFGRRYNGRRFCCVIRRCMAGFYCRRYRQLFGEYDACVFA